MLTTEVMTRAGLGQARALPPDRATAATAKATASL